MQDRYSSIVSLLQKTEQLIDSSRKLIAEIAVRLARQKQHFNGQPRSNRTPHG